MGSQSTGSATTAETAGAAASSNTYSRDERLSSGAKAAEEGVVLDPRISFRIDCLRNARYHEDREWFFAIIHKLTMFVVVLGGTAAFAFVNQYRWAVALISIAAIVDLVFDVSGKARLHAGLRRRYNYVLAQSYNPSRDLASLEEQAVSIYGEEPPCMHAVNALAYNAAMRAFDRPEKKLLQITNMQRLLRHLWAYTAEDFKTGEEVDRSRASDCKQNETGRQL